MPFLLELKIVADRKSEQITQRLVENMSVHLHVLVHVSLQETANK